MDELKIMIAGDMVITKDCSLFSKPVDGALLNLLTNADLNIVNLECPVTKASNNQKIFKTGPHLKGEETAIEKVMKELKIGLVTLANNHILDYGVKGLKDTLLFCEKNKIESVGAGENLKAAQKAYRKTIKGYKLSIINFAENEWGSATDSTAGANPMDLIENVKQIKKEKEFSDFVFIIIHGGHEYYNLPSPRMQKQYRFYAENGANLIVGHHTHCIGGNEIYNGVPIYYSLGNFLFTKKSNFADWYQGVILEITIDKNKNLFTKLNLIEQEKNTYCVKLLQEEERRLLIIKVNELSEIIKNEEKLKANWKSYVLEKQEAYLNYWSPLSFVKSHFFKKVFIKLGIKGLNKQGMALVLNLMRCEAHSDLSKDVINNYIQK